MAELSVFVDEAGDFGPDSVYYVPALDADRAIHTGPAIRGESEYRGLPVEVRRREFNRLYAFARRAPVLHQAFSFRKREHPSRLRLKGAISRALSQFLQDNAAYFLSFDRVIVYYDNGQAEITDVLNTLFNAFFFGVEFRRVVPARYRLFQVADLHCTLELLRLKLRDGTLSRSDLFFFGSRRALRKDYLNKLENRQFSRRKR